MKSMKQELSVENAVKDIRGTSPTLVSSLLKVLKQYRKCEILGLIFVVE